MSTKRTPKKVLEEPDNEQLNALVHNRGIAKRIITRIRDTLRDAEEQETELTSAQLKVC